MVDSSKQWHLEVTLVQATLRRYVGQDAKVAYAAQKPYDAIASVDIRGTSAELSKMLVLPPKLTRSDRREIESLLRALGVTEFGASRHGKPHQLPPDVCLG